jgi:uncharacterized protein
VTCAEQLDELKATLRKPAIAARVKPYRAGHLVNELKELAETIGPLPRVERSPDPTDDFLLALAEAGKADYLVTGDKMGLLSLTRHGITRILSASEFTARIVGAGHNGLVTAGYLTQLPHLNEQVLSLQCGYSEVFTTLVQFRG